MFSKIWVNRKFFYTHTHTNSHDLSSEEDIKKQGQMYIGFPVLNSVSAGCSALPEGFFGLIFVVVSKPESSFRMVS